jgi:hypothetical protein
MGINLGLKYKGFDLSTFLVWNQGGDLFNYTKYFTDMRVFIGGVSERVLYEGWNPATRTGVLPQLGNGATDGYTSFIRATSSDYYIENASYLRGKLMQLGYTIPSSLAAKMGLQNARVYFQAQNYFTITKYSGPDPDIAIQGDDLFMGLDDSAVPQPRQVLVGLNITF